MPEPLKPVLDITLAGARYRLARNGRFSLHRPLAPDAFGVVAHEPVMGFEGEEWDANPPMTPAEMNALLQLLGTYIERCHSLEAAVQKGAP